MGGLQLMLASAAAVTVQSTSHRLFGYGLVDGGGTVQIANINVTTASVSWSTAFHVASTDQGCNVAFGIDASTKASVYFVPDGSTMQPPGATYSYHTVDMTGAVLRTVNATPVSYDPVFVAYDSANDEVYGIGSQPNSVTVDLLSFNPYTGQTKGDVLNISWIEEMPSCVGAATARRDGYFYFVNGLIHKYWDNQLVVFDATTGTVVNQQRGYIGGLIPAITPWNDTIIALLWPNVGNPTLAQIEPLNHKWEPKILHNFTDGHTPLQGVMTAIDSTVYALMNSADGGQVLMTADLSTSPPTVAMKPIDVSHAPFGVWVLGAVSE